MSQENWIRNGRKAVGWSQARLGEKIGVSQVQVSQWENGKGAPTTEQEEALRKMLKVLSPNPPSRVEQRKSSAVGFFPAPVSSRKAPKIQPPTPAK